MPHKLLTDAERLNKMRQDFVANVSHELRTPLTVIHGYVDTLLGLYGEDANLTEIFTNMRQQTQRMESLIEDLLLLAKIENESPVAAFEPIKLNTMLHSLKCDMQQLGKQHELSWMLNPNLELLGSAPELRSAFSNLIINAIRYTKAGGTITIESGVLKTEEPYFQVSDTGIGIAANDIPRLTERFYRVDKGRARQSGGTGLGLAIVKHVLLRHQAELQIESALNRGSLFRCVFPLARLKISGNV